MAGEKDDATRRGYDPLVSGISDGVSAGYQALEYVLDGLRESLERRAWSTPRDGRGRRTGEHGRRSRHDRGGPPVDLVDDVAYIVAEVLERAGEVAQDVARSITERSWVPGRPGAPERLEMRGTRGATAEVDFHVWNTSMSALRDIHLRASELIGDEERIPADNVTFVPTHIDRIPPGRHRTAKIVVDVPKKIAPATYRGVVQADPGGWAVLELTVVHDKKGAPAPGKKAAKQAAEEAEQKAAEKAARQAAEAE